VVSLSSNKLQYHVLRASNLPKIFFCHCAIVEKNEVGTVNDELETGEIGRIKGEKAVQTSEKNDIYSNPIFIN
jgi:hypothetical protein